MSTSILYLAIVAIWACFLVPAWLRRPQAPAADAEYDSEAGGWAERTADTESDVDVVVRVGIDAEVDRRLAQNAGADLRYAAAPVFVADPQPAWADEADPAGPESATAEYADPQYAAADHANAEPDARVRPAQTSQSRQQMLRARRRMLTILVAISGLTAAFTALGEVRWWICVPPAGMLVLYVLLLREIAMADAELARKRAAWLERAERQAAEARRQRAHAAWAPRSAQSASTDDGDSASRLTERTAKIIDISSRVGDQLYDQYADAAVRAVGD
jgi:hypothetical protein